MEKINILIVGIGGAGCNAIEQLQNDLAHHNKVSFLAINTDAQALEQSTVPNMLILGKERLRGLSAGGDPKLARKVAEFDKDRIVHALSGADLVILVAGLGGGTGSGAAPFIAQIAKKQGALVLSFATLPFTLEGGQRNRTADLALVELRAFSHAAIPLPNDLLLQQLDPDATVLEAFNHSNQWIHKGVNSLIHMMNTPGLMNIDFSTLRNALAKPGGNTLFALASASGPNYVEQALNELMLSPLLYLPQSTNSADSIIINIIGGTQLSLKAVNHIGSYLSQQFKSKENTTIGAVIDDSKGDSIEICVIGITRSSRTTSNQKGRGHSSDNPNQQVLFNDSSFTKENSPSGSSNQQRGYFYETESNLFNGEDLDIPTYLRRGIRIKL